jgi:dTDP-D-glucose 4,6-dehydratase
MPMWAKSVRDPGKYYRNNVAGTLTLLEAVRGVLVPWGAEMGRFAKQTHFPRGRQRTVDSP